MHRVSITLPWDIALTDQSDGGIRDKPGMDVLMCYYLSEIAIKCNPLQSPKPAGRLTSSQQRAVRKAEAAVTKKAMANVRYFMQDTVRYSSPWYGEDSLASSVRTKKFSVSLGEVPADINKDSPEFKYMEAQNTTKEKAAICEAGGFDMATYPWPTIAGYRGHGTVGMISISWRGRWQDGLDRRALLDAWERTAWSRWKNGIA